MDEELFDVIVIGGGPAGLTAAQYASRAGLNTIVLDKSSSAGALAFASRLENYPGLTTPASGMEILERFRKQALDFGARYIEAQVIGVNLGGVVKEVFTMERNFSGKSVIIATGSMGRKATIKGEAEFLGRGVSYCAVCDGPFFKGKRVSVIGSSEEAVKEAVFLSRSASEVLLVSPAHKLGVEEAHPVMRTSNVKILTGSAVIAIEGAETVQQIKILRERHEEVLEVSGVFVCLHGSRPIIDFIGGALELSEDDCLMVNRAMQTSIPGVFAAGDVICTEMRQVVLAAANGCVAALSAEKYIQHRKKTRHDWGKH